MEENIRQDEMGMEQKPNAERVIYASPMGGTHSEYEAFHANSGWIELTEFHNHDFYEIYLHLNGGQLLWVEDSAYELIPDCLFIFQPFQMHGIVTNAPLTDYERAFLYITPELMHSLGQDLVDFDATFRALRHQSDGMFSIPRETCVQCVSLLHQIAARAENDSPQARLLDRAQMMEFLLLVYGVVADRANAHSPMERSTPVRTCIDYIHANYSQPLSLPEIASACCISQSYLSHTFRDITGRSVYNYIQYYRITRARWMIAGSSGAREEGDELSAKTMTEIALACGFGDYSSFLRAFRKETGMSPKAYARQHQE